jgi:hypothetical protein
VLSGEECLALARYVEDGGGVLAFADGGMAGDAFWAGARELLPARGASVRTPARPTRLFRLDYGHAALRGFADGANGEIESVEFRGFLELRGTGRDSEALAFFSGTDPPAPAIVSSTRGRGRAILLAAGPTREWGALYREPAFVPLVHEAVAYLARAEGALRVFTVGDRPTVRLRPSERGATAVLEALRPEGGLPASCDLPAAPACLRLARGRQAVAAQAGAQAGGPDRLRRRLEVDPERLAVELGRLDRRGVFRLTTRSPAGERARAFAVELDPRESDARRLDPSDLLGGTASTAGPARSAGDLARRVVRARGGAEVTACLRWAALALFALEMLVSWRLTRRRSAAAGREANLRGAI